MTYEELNEVRSLKRKIREGQNRIKALEECMTPSGVKFTRSYEYYEDSKGNKKQKSYPSLDIQPKGKNTASPTEVLAIMLADEKKELSALQERLKVAIPELTTKILSAVEDATEQTLLIYRYVACEYFRDIGFKLGYSEQWVYWKHKRILKKIRVD